MIEIAEIVDVSKEALQLRDAYLKAGIITPKYSDNALHVALASVSNCSLIVSWNFKHIVKGSSQERLYPCYRVR